MKKFIFIPVVTREDMEKAWLENQDKVVIGMGKDYLYFKKDKEDTDYQRLTLNEFFSAHPEFDNDSYKELIESSFNSESILELEIDNLKVENLVIEGIEVAENPGLVLAGGQFEPVPAINEIGFVAEGPDDEVSFTNPTTVNINGTEITIDELVELYKNECEENMRLENENAQLFKENINLIQERNKLEADIYDLENNDARLTELVKKKGYILVVK